MDLCFDKELVLENERVLLRPLKADDVAHLLPAALSDPLLLQYSPAPVCSEALLRQYITAALAERASGQRYPFTIFDKQQNAYAGSTSFAAVSNKDQRLEIGYTWLGKSFQKTGLNRNCKLLLISFVFETLRFERVEFKVDERNTASRVALEKIGAKMEGILRSHTVLHDGFRRNTVYYSILRHEWLELKQKFVY